MRERERDLFSKVSELPSITMEILQTWEHSYITSFNLHYTKQKDLKK